MGSGTRITTTGVLYINGSQVENTFTNVSKITRKLESELKKLTPGTQEFINKAQEVRRARERFEEVKNEINAVSRAVDNSTEKMSFLRRNLLGVGDTFRQVFTADLASRFFDVIIQKGKLTVDQLLNIADAMTDVQKTSGMTLEQVKELWDEFDEMDTRTSKLDRLKIAEVGGRLGVPIAEMKSFVAEVDKAYVALGDSFEGGLEGVVDQLGKIKGLFEETESMSYAEAINRVGSALNTLAAQGTASEGNISQFALRVGTLPSSLRPAIDKVLGLGAAFEESGIDAQIASSGYSNFMTTAGKNIEAFAYSMNLSVAEAKELLNTKPEEFFLKFAEGMKGLDGVETSKVLESLKLNSLEVQKAVGAAANKTDDFRKAMKTAGVEMEKMTSLTDEANQKNNNAPAILQKITNAFNDMFTSTNIINHFEWFVNILGWVTGVTKDAGEEITGFKERVEFLGKILLVLISSIISYNLALTFLAFTTKSVTQQTILYNLVQKAKIVWDTLAKGATLLYAAAKLLLAGNTARATVAMRAFNIATKANPLGLLIGLLTAAFAAMVVFSNKTKETKDALRNLNAEAAINIEHTRELSKSTNDLKSKIDPLIKVLNDEAASLNVRKKAYETLIQISPEFIGTVDAEYLATNRLSEAYDKLIKKLDQAALARARESVRQKRAQELAEAETAEYEAKLKADAERASNKLNENFKKGQKNGGNVKSRLTGEALGLFSENSDAEREYELAKTKTKLAKSAMDGYSNYQSGRVKEIEKEIKKVDNLIKINSKNVDGLSQDNLKRLSAYKTELNDELNTFLTTEENNPSVSGKTNVTVPDAVKKNKVVKGEDPKKKAEADLKSAQEEAKKAEQAKLDADKRMLEIQRAFEDEKNKILAESRQTAIDAETLDFERRKQDLINQNIDIQREILESEKQIKNLEKSKSETKSPEAKKEYDVAISGLESANKKRENLKLTNDQIIEQFEKTHRFNLQKINEIWDAKDFERFINSENARINENRRNNEDEINNITSLAEAKEKLQNLQYLKLTDSELKNIQSLEDAKRFLREEADRKMLAAQLVSFEKQKEMLVTAISQLTDGEVKEKLIADLELLRDKITQVQTAINGGGETDDKAVKEESSAKKDKVDILGFSVKDWEETFSNLDTTEGKVAAVAKVFAAMGNLAASFADLQRSLGERDLKRFKKEQSTKQKELLKSLNQGFISQEEYHKGIELLDAQLANKQAEIEYKQAKAEKVSRIFSAIGATAQGIAAALAVGPPQGIVLAAIVGALGAAQVATIAAQPLPEKPSFAKGGFFEGYTGDSNLPEDTSGERPVGNVLLHRKEWVSPRWMTENPRLASTFQYLENIRKNKAIPMAAGGYVAESSQLNPTAQNQNNQDNTSFVEYISVLTDVRELLQKLSDDGVLAYMIEDAENGKKILRTIKMYEKIEQRASGK